MKTIVVSPRKKSIQELLEQASNENLLLLMSDGREFIVAELDNSDREVELTRQNEALMRLLDERGKEPGTVSLSEARAQLLAD